MTVKTVAVNVRNGVSTSLRRLGILPSRICTDHWCTHLLPLVDDILIPILCLCDIVTVVSVSATCKHLYRLAFCKSVWLALLSDLQARNFIYLSPGKNLVDFSSAALIKLAKRTAHGPHSWLKSPRRKPTVAHRVILNPGINNLPGFRKDHVTLLPGGQYILIFASGMLRCWNVAEDRLVWDYGSSSDPGPLVRISAVEVVEEGRAVIVVASFSRTIGAHLCDHIVQVNRLSFSDESRITIASVTYGHDPTHSQCHHHRYAKLCGNFVFVERGVEPNGVLLLRLSPFSYRMFELPSHRCQVELIGGHLIITELDDSTYACVKIRIWNADSFLESPFSNELDESALICHSMSARGSKCYSHHLSAHASPLREGLYIIWVSTDAFINGRHTLVIRKYYLLPLERTCYYKAAEPRFPDSSKFWWDRLDASISFSGHMTVYRHLWDDLHDRGYEHGFVPLGECLTGREVDRKEIRRQKPALKMLRRKDRGLRVIELTYDANVYGGFDGNAQLSAYGGVLTHVTDKHVVIEYYE